MNLLARHGKTHKFEDYVGSRSLRGIDSCASVPSPSRLLYYLGQLTGQIPLS